MAANTQKFSVTSEEWVQVSNGEANVGIQLISLALVFVYVGDLAPDENSTGIQIGRHSDVTPSEFSASNLPETSGVYVKGSGNQNVDLVVMKY